MQGEPNKVNHSVAGLRYLMQARAESKLTHPGSFCCCAVDYRTKKQLSIPPFKGARITSDFSTDREARKVREFKFSQNPALTTAAWVNMMCLMEFKMCFSNFNTKSRGVEIMYEHKYV